MLELVETVGARTAAPIGFVPPATGTAAAATPSVTGDADLGALLIDVGQLLDADALGLVHVTAGARVGGTLAAVALSDHSIEPDDLSSRLKVAFEQIDEPAGAPVDDRIAAAMLRPRPNDRVGLYVITDSVSPVARRATASRLATFVPLIERALALWMKAHVERLLRDDQRAALDHFASGLVIVDGDGAIHFANRAAQALLADASDVFDADGRLMLRDVQTAMHLQVALHHLLSRPAGDAVADPLVMLIGRAGRFPLVLAVCPIGGERARPRAIVQLIDVDPEPSLPLDAIGNHFDLTPVERRLIDQLVQGRTVAEAADAMRLKEQTARTYLKQVFQKTGIRRQTDLVSTMLKAALPLFRA